MKAARWYQIEAVNALFQYFYSANGNPLIALPTGAGKSFVIADFLQKIFERWPHQRVMMLTHVKELVAQNAVELQALWPNAPLGIYSAGLKKRDLHYPITFGSIQSVVKVIAAFGHIDLLLIDEAHLLGDNDNAIYMIVIAELKRRNPYLKIIGLSATCWRTKMGLLTNGPIFTDIIYNLCTIEGFRRLFDEGYLVPPRAKATQIEYDVSNVSMTGEDYAKGQLNEVTRNEKVTWDALQESLRLGADRNCRLVFCTGVDHAILAADMLKHMGLNAASVHSKMPEADRDAYMRGFLGGEIDSLANNGICTTGLNCPRIDHIIMLRPTMSVGLWIQMLGRGTRPFEFNGWHKEDCLVTDHAGNCRRLGTIDDPYIPKMKGKGTGDAPVKICPACGCYNPASARYCEDCGELFEKRIGFKETASEEPLVRSDLPIYETYNVDHCYYTQYLKKNAQPGDKPCIKATYQCDMHRFTEYVHIEAAGFGAKRARSWWRQRFPTQAGGYMPTTVNEAMQYVDKLIAPKQIKIWINRKFPEITEYLF